jgi:hypothetical protein
MQTSAYDTLNQRVFVKISHLGIALCGIAHYFTCYTNINPPDIHACFEVYIGDNGSL